jgi:hypothetical protein
MSETREIIKERMLRTASAAWGYADKANGSAFDPLVGLLMDVYASELEKISQEIGMSRERVLQKIVQLMVPDVFTAPVPAQGILHVRSVGEAILLKDKEQFYVAGRHTPASAADIWFSPAGQYYVTDACVKYMAAGHTLYRYTGAADREIVRPTERTIPANTLWLGISGDPGALSRAQFYFDLRRGEGKEAFYHHLKEAGWWLGNRRLRVRPGFNSPMPEDDRLGDWLKTSHSVSRPVMRLVSQLYGGLFVSIEAMNASGREEGEMDGAEEREIPDELGQALERNNVFPAALAEQWKQEKICWIKIQFPENIHAGVLEDLYCQINCIPVINRQLHELTHRLQDRINIIPLVSQQPFFDLHAVTDQDGSALQETAPEVPDQERSRLSILLRKGGAGRFDERDARAVIRHLLQLLRDESAAFSMYGRDFITEEIQQVQQTINRLSQHLADRDPATDPVAYLEVTGTDPDINQHLSIEYWSTQGAKANHVKAGTPAMAYRNGALQQTGCCLVMTTRGGRDRLQPHESIPAFKSAVLSRDRIMSAEDIRLFCLRETGPMTRSVEVKKGVMIAAGGNAGFMKTIDVFIGLDKKEFLDMEGAKAREYWQQRLAAQLAERSMSFMPFRVFFKEEVNSNDQ